MSPVVDRRDEQIHAEIAGYARKIEELRAELASRAVDGAATADAIFDFAGYGGGGGGGHVGHNVLNMAQSEYTNAECREQGKCFWCGAVGHLWVTSDGQDGFHKTYTCPRHPRCGEACTDT